MATPNWNNDPDWNDPGMGLEYGRNDELMEDVSDKRPTLPHSGTLELKRVGPGKREEG